MHSNACTGSIVFDGSLIVETLEIVLCHVNVSNVDKPACFSLIVIFSEFSVLRQFEEVSS